MEIIRYAELKPLPWRNGGGATRELARFPAAAAGQTAAADDGTWDWRVSIAEVARAGAFSRFAGMERVLTVVDGELLLLTVDGAEHPLVKYRPFRFTGDADAAGALPTGDIRDLNVITRAGAFKGYTSIIELSKKRAHPVFAGQFGILLQGQATVSEGSAAEADAAGDEGEGSDDAGTAAPQPLGRYDAVVGSDTGTPEILGRGFLAVVSIDPVDSADPGGAGAAG
ncbi:HutD family protein [uncultured Arthrobacter sp.]|uniref:HutD/Ves family protein n=1 Tax=uncultured Arthrobacter sp. TaxID=114050 RepID=UPI0032164A83